MTNIFRRAPEIVQTLTPAPVAAAPPPPVPTPVATIPTVDDEEVRRARQLNMEQQLARGGRRSTILTSPATRGAGGDSYSSERFG